MTPKRGVLNFNTYDGRNKAREVSEFLYHTLWSEFYRLVLLGVFIGSRNRYVDEHDP